MQVRWGPDLHVPVHSQTATPAVSISGSHLASNPHVHVTVGGRGCSSLVELSAPPPSWLLLSTPPPPVSHIQLTPSLQPPPRVISEEAEWSWPQSDFLSSLLIHSLHVSAKPDCSSGSLWAPPNSLSPGSQRTGCLSCGLSACLLTHPRLLRWPPGGAATLVSGVPKQDARGVDGSLLRQPPPCPGRQGLLNWGGSWTLLGRSFQNLRCSHTCASGAGEPHAS